MAPRQLVTVLAAAVVATALAAVAAAALPAGAPPAPAQLFVVQAVPDSTYTVSVDGDEEATGAEVGAVLGPFEVEPGEHSVRFAPAEGQPMTATVRVRAGSSTDLVLHLPAEVGGDPVADTYRASSEPVAPDMARVLVAHTATVAPADVRVDGQVVFEDIANGEYAVADVPAGEHSAALVPAGTGGEPILGPLAVDLPAGTVTMVYAVGTPTNGSMNVITHQEAVRTSGAAPPRRIRTGSGGLVHRIAPFER